MERGKFLHRSRSHLHEYKHGITKLFETRSNSPGQPDIISSAKPIEEETLPKYNPENFYPTRLGEVLNDTYKIVAKLGYGMTATVWLARNLRVGADDPRRFVTIKINVNTLSEDFFRGRRKIAEKIASTNPHHAGYTHVRFTIETFKIRSRAGKEHLCIVYDVMREPIDVCMCKWTDRRFNGRKLRLLVKGLLQGLDYLHSECHVVHTDLKPDNIMMGLGNPAVLDKFAQHEQDHPAPRKAPDSHGRVIYKSCSDFGGTPDIEEMITTAKIIDLGLAELGDEKHNHAIQSNAFTAPEVLLAAGWSYPADIWNFGVMLWDLTESMGLFDAIDTSPGKYSSAQHLGLMIALLGPPPKELLERGSTTSTYFDEHGEFRKPQYIQRDQTFEHSITSMKGEEKALFIDFAKKMVCWLPEQRWTAKQLLQHPFLTKQSFDCREYETETKDTMRLIEEFAINKKTGTPVAGSPYRTPLSNTTPVSTSPQPSPEPSIKGFSMSNRAHTIAHSPMDNITSAPSSTVPRTSMPATNELKTTRSRKSTNTNNIQSQDLIDHILGHKGS
ncbi:hypothetical protein DV738_g1546, partial [Chaetothyriales sp. CBS 135597]